ncbi:hypothetical protein LguiA_025361 [Lonicera macranthoides]
MRKNTLRSTKSTLTDAKNIPAKYDDADALATIVRSMSMHSGATKQRLIAEEILRYGNAKPAAEVFTFRELATATDNFSQDLLVGEGGFGRVYKGTITHKNQIVAVKQIDRNRAQGNKEFLAEVLTLSLVNHPNLVDLVGYCSDGNQRLLVSEYMPKGSLDQHLYGVRKDKKRPLDWYTRMKIAKGAASGLEYLHDVANPPIIYRDFKTSNILLDNEFNPKLSDFGLSKLGLTTADKANASTRVMTYGYSAPEYSSGQLTTKSDVYSFGVVFLEMISGRKAIDTTRPPDEQNLVTWAQPLFKDKTKFELMADPSLKGKYPVKDLYQALAVAAMCLQEEASTRPFISDVVTTLEYLSVK